MSTLAEKVVTQALELPAPLRAFVAEKLIESLDQQDVVPMSDEWMAEVVRRCAEIDGGAVTLRNANDVFAEAHQTLA